MAEVSSPPTTQNTIVLRTNSLGGIHYREGYATTTIYPGFLVEKDASGSYPYGSYKPHATQGGECERLFAVELGMIADVPFASTFSGGTINDAYGTGNFMRMFLAAPGDEIYAYLKASGSAVTPTDFLQSAGTGEFEKLTSTNVKLAKPLESKTPAATRTRCRVVVI